MPAVINSIVSKKLITLLLLQIMTITTANAYSIGTPGQPWGKAEYKQWKDTRIKERCYHTNVVPAVQALSDKYDVVEYGQLSNDTEGDKDFPLFAVRSKEWSDDKPNVFITGGVHGYETSGVEGALLFLSEPTTISKYSKHFNICVIPCVSPWGYERIQRWTSKGTDPNRSFNPDGEIVEGRSFNPEAATEESTAIINFLKNEMSHAKEWLCHIDLHETTDTDETEFRLAKAARDGLDSKPGEIPDGFYLVQDETSPMDAWFTAMIDSVRKVTHITPNDADGLIIGEKISQEGVIVIPNKKSLGLCAGVTDAPYRTTTEVYPDSPKATPEICNQAQVACIEGGLDHIISVL